jgi:signal peptidase I
MIWKGLGLVTNTESPIVVVLRCAYYIHLSTNCPDTVLLYSGSMEPAFYRGDILFLINPVLERYTTGDITVYKIPGADIPIVHRVLETHDVPPKAKSSGYVHLGCFVVGTLNIFPFNRLDPWMDCLPNSCC